LGESSGADCLLRAGFVGRSGSGGGAGEGDFVIGADIDCGSTIGSLSGIPSGVEDSSSVVSNGVRLSGLLGVSKDVVLAELLLSPSPTNVYPFKLFDIELLSNPLSSPKPFIVPDLETDVESVNIDE